MDRPYINASGDEIRGLIDEAWDDFWKLGLLAYELQFRRSISKERRGAVIERLVELGVQGGRVVSDEPGFRFPTTDIRSNRRLARSALGQVDWRESGLLRMSGYRVGTVQGVKERKRHRILNFIFLEDDLSDVDDRSYALEWGRPRSTQRLKKLADTIAALARNGKRHPGNLDQAVKEWEADLEYLKRAFYDRWGDFSWPAVGE